MLNCRYGPPFAVCHFYIIISLIILEQNVIFWAVVLYEAAFQNKGLKLTVAEDIIKIRNISTILITLILMIILRAEILADSVFECLRLADIYYFSL